jgi:outer membrane lipase/esterase
LLNALVSNPVMFGFSNVTDACLSVSACVNGTLAQQNEYLFWDDVHPTTGAFSLLAGQFTAAVVPEPADSVLIAAGVLLVIAATRRRD